MELSTFWFILVGVLFAGFFVLEGFDFGVGMLLPFVARDDRQRRMTINTIGAVWDGNEVWLLTAGGAIFAAFPHWYATLFSGFYLPLAVILLGLIVRGVGLEFRSKLPSPRWRATWDALIAVGSLLPALIFGVAVGNFLRGVPIDATKTYTGGFFNLLNPFALLAGVTFVLLFALHGALFLRLRTSGPVLERASAAAKGLWIPAVLAAVGLLGYGAVEAHLFAKGATAYALAGAAAVALLAAGLLAGTKPGWAFSGTALTILLVTALTFTALYPNVLPSTTDPQFSLTVRNACSTPKTLTLMSYIALTLVPVVLAYQGWTYWVFRKRLTDSDPLEY